LRPFPQVAFLILFRLHSICSTDGRFGEQTIQSNYPKIVDRMASDDNSDKPIRKDLPAHPPGSHQLDFKSMGRHPGGDDP
jgi:hypothetical protein